MPPKAKKDDGAPDEAKLRIAIVSQDKCKPNKCQLECKKSCPAVRVGKLAVEVDKKAKSALISEPLCIGCGICVKKCPFEAIDIINLPRDMSKDTTHRYGPNAFKLHRLPTPRPGQVLGLVGCNGAGTSTEMKILSGALHPNLGRFDSPPDWKEILTYFRGNELQAYFNRLKAKSDSDKLVTAMKPQHVDHLPKVVRGRVGQVLEAKEDQFKLNRKERLLQDLDLAHLVEREVKDLSGGELQRFAIAVVCVQGVDVYMFDEPSSYLDVRQRMRAAHTIRDLVGDKNYVIVIEHDLSVLDYLSDFVCVIWGRAGAYGVITMPFSVREGINIFLDGFIPTENLRFREAALNFKTSEGAEGGCDRMQTQTYPHLIKTLGTFQMTVFPGDFSDSEIIVLLGQNGTGKTTLIRMLAGLLRADPLEGDAKQVMMDKYGHDGSEKNDDGNDVVYFPEIPRLSVSYKPQKISAKFQGTVRDLLRSKINDSYNHAQFNADVVKPMLIDPIADLEVQHLSGGEMQRVALTLALGKPADMYLIDEPSAHLDVEQRIVAAKVIKRYILHARKTAFVVEHDFIMSTYLADKVVVLEGDPGVQTIANSPQSLVSGMNQFLTQLETTFRRDPTNYRPRINKKDSQKDQEQKGSGNYFLLEE